MAKADPQRAGRRRNFMGNTLKDRIISHFLARKGFH
jgi:hypothetical protein